MVLHGLVLLWSWFLLRCGESHWAKIAVFSPESHPIPLHLYPRGVLLPHPPPSFHLRPPKFALPGSRSTHPFTATLPFQPQICHFQPQNPSTLSLQFFLSTSSPESAISNPKIHPPFHSNSSFNPISGISIPKIHPPFPLLSTSGPESAISSPKIHPPFPLLYASNPKPGISNPKIHLLFLFWPQICHFQLQNPSTLSFLIPNSTFMTPKSTRPFLALPF